MAISKCGACGRVFGGVAGFDAHRHHEATRVQTGSRCAHPAVLGMVERDGVWRSPMSQAARERIQDIKNVRTAPPGWIPPDGVSPEIERADATIAEVFGEPTFDEIAAEKRRDDR
jgi:hypothetical protein